MSDTVIKYGIQRLLYLCCAVIFLASEASGQSDYERVVEEINGNLSELRELNSCPGVSLAQTCGDGICDRSKGEDEVTCPTDCLHTPVQSYNSQTFCKEIREFYAPKSTLEIQELVRSAVSRGMHVRAVGKAHTSNAQMCTDGVAISTENLNHVLGVESFQGHETVVLEPGVKLGEMTDWLSERGKSLGYAVMGFRGMTVGGAIATGAHGSSPRHPAVISSLVEALTVVKADGALVEFNERDTPPDVFKALRAHLGMLGVIVKIRLRIQSQFNLKVEVTHKSDQVLFTQEGLRREVEKCDYALMNWFPHTSLHRGSRGELREGIVSKICGKQVGGSPDVGATNVLLDPAVPQFIVKPFKEVLQYGACFSGLNCLLENLRFLSFRLQPPFKRLHHDGKSWKYVNHLTGLSHRMMASDITQAEMGLHEKDWEVAVPLSEAPKVLEEIRSHLLFNKTCFPLFGVLLRFVPSEDSTLIAHTTSGVYFEKGTPLVLIELPAYMPVGFSAEKQRDYQRQHEEIVEFLIQKYHGRGHWGKNEEWVFQMESEENSFGPNWDRFRKIIHDMDPTEVFSNSFSKVVGLTR